MKIAKNPDLLGVIEITGSSDGPRAVIFAGVHGDEVSGIHAIDKLLFDFFGGERTLTRGSLLSRVEMPTRSPRSGGT